MAAGTEARQCCLGGRARTSARYILVDGMHLGGPVTFRRRRWLLGGPGK